MEENTKKFNTFDDYITQYPLEIQQRLEEIRHAIKSVVPESRAN